MYKPKLAVCRLFHVINKGILWLETIKIPRVEGNEEPDKHFFLFFGGDVTLDENRWRARRYALTVGDEEIQIQAVLGVLIAAHLVHHHLHIHDFVEQLVQHHRVLLLGCISVLVAVGLSHWPISNSIPPWKVIHDGRAKAIQVDWWLGVRYSKIRHDALRPVHFHEHPHDRALLFDLHCRRIATHHLQDEQTVAPEYLREKHFPSSTF